MNMTTAARLVCPSNTEAVCKRSSSPALHETLAKACAHEQPLSFGLRRCSGAFQVAYFVRLFTACIAGGLLIAADPASAATLRWTGGHATSSDWSRLANWDTGTAPVDGDTLVFPAGAARLVNNNDIAGLRLAAIRFSGASGGYTLGGNGVVVTTSITSTNSAGANTISADPPPYSSSASL